MTRCEEVRVELPLLLSGELSGPALEELEAHVESCGACAAELADLRVVTALAAYAPLEHEPPPQLEDHVFGFVELEPVARLVAQAPLGGEAPLDLERKSLERAGLGRTAGGERAGLGRTAGRTFGRVATVAVPALAASVVVLAFLGASWRSDAVKARSQASVMRERLGPWGRTMENVQFAVAATAPPEPQVSAQFVQTGDTNYVLHMRISNYWPTPPGRVCQVWLVSAGTTPAPVGTFVVENESGSFITNWSVAVDPRSYEMLRVTLEPDSDGTIDGVTLMEAHLDP